MVVCRRRFVFLETPARSQPDAAVWNRHYNYRRSRVAYSNLRLSTLLQRYDLMQLDLWTFYNRGIGLGSVGLDLLTRELG